MGLSIKGNSISCYKGVETYIEGNAENNCKGCSMNCKIKSDNNNITISFTPIKEKYRCSFCGKNNDKVSKMVAGPGVYICNECIDLCVEIINERYDVEVEEIKSYTC